MTADQLIAEMFVNHWLITTFIAPWAAWVYAFATNQIGWALGSSALWIFYEFGKSRRKCKCEKGTP